MTVTSGITVTRKMDIYFNREKPGTPACLLKAVRRALDDIKKEAPCVTGLNIAEIAFLRNQQGEISLRVYFE